MIVVKNELLHCTICKESGLHYDAVTEYYKELNDEFRYKHRNCNGLVKKLIRGIIKFIRIMRD
jgi:hypothetical protein